MIPVHTQDGPLLGMKWQGQVFVDKTLPFGLRSAPMIFSAAADALLWLMRQKGASVIEHYIDDFITAGRPQSEECQRNFETMHEVCNETGTPVEQEKLEGPSTKITFLGMELDSMAMEIRLPTQKLTLLKQSLGEWRGKKACRKRELLSLIGLISHTCKAVKAGRSFLRRLINLSTQVSGLDHYVRVNKGARSDLEWWFRFVETWNGRSMLHKLQRQNPQAVLVSDASGSWGCGAFWVTRWFQLQWPAAVSEYHITVKELIPIVLAAAVWEPEWLGLTVEARCDNAAAVEIVNWGDSKVPEVMHLMRCLAFIMAKYQFYLFATHIKGSSNHLADALSRNRHLYFLNSVPQAQQAPTHLSQELLDLIIIEKPDWTSRRWTELWSFIFKTD